MEDFAEFVLTRPPTASRPLMGLTVLVVEDSRFACEALRLLCLKSGARIRRADSLRAARRHLRVYRPSVVVIDLGLPDGSGIDLIRELARTQPRPVAILATSGDPAGREEALRAGANGFLEKPIHSLGDFQEAVLAHLPPEAQPPGPRLVQNTKVVPDALAFRDDMAHAADIISGAVDEKELDYLARFLMGVARSARDRSLEAAAGALERARQEGSPMRSHLARVAGMVQERMDGRQTV